MEKIYPAVWMALPKATRAHLAERFSIKPSGVTEVRDQDVVSDGYTVADLGAITLEKLCAYVGSKETFIRAWEIALSKANYEMNPPIELPAPVAEEKIPAIVEEKIIESVQDKPFCDKCISKGGRHLRNCPNFK